MQQMKHLKTWLDEISSKLGPICILQALFYEGGMVKQPVGGGSKHITRSQKGYWMLNIINQNQTFILLLPFKTIVIMAS
jgi:hypothetical protein